MASNRRDFDDHAFDFEALVSDPSSPNDAKLSQWARGPAGLDPAPAADARVAPRAQAAALAVRRTTRGQGLSWLALVLAVAVSALVGGGAYTALAAVDITRAGSFRTASHWVSVVIIGLVGLVVTLVLAIVALGRSRPRLVATVALVLTILLPAISLVVGVKFGLDALVRHVHEDAGAGAGNGAAYFAGWLAERGVDVGPFRELISHIFG